MIDKTTVEVIHSALVYAAEEMGIALKKSAYSPNIKERMDHSCALFDSQRRLIAQAEHIPVHLGSMALGVREGIAAYSGRLDPSDMILLNDPYISGTHLPDLTLIAPIYQGTRLLGYAANKAHHTDIGGKAPGSIAGDSTELYQEGLIIPPIKFVKAGIIDPELSWLLRSNVRTPEIQMGDLRAQIAANNTGIRRVLELAGQYGADDLNSAMEEIMDYSERRMRAVISSMPKGVYESSDFMEDVPNVGLAEIRVKITIDVNCITFDYSGTCPQVEAPLNAPLGVTIAGIYYTLISVTDPTIPVNDGCFRPITLHIPEGTIMNPRRPAPVAGGNVETSQRNVDVLMKAFSEITPDRIPAAGLGTMNNVGVGGIRLDGTPWTFYETIGGGSGGRPDGDGVDGIHVNMTNTMNTPIESLEAYLPMHFISYGLRPDTGGAGEYRGGCGIERSWTLTSPKAILSILAERTKIQPWGLEGGKGGALGEYKLVKKNGESLRLPSKCTIQIEEGDTLTVHTPGGGGYGFPRMRNPQAVLRDVLNGLVSLESAKEYYAVFIRDGVVDEEETSLLRAGP
jgi:N-methylhydantoinase B